MVADADEDPVETKHSFVDYSVEIKPPKVEASVKIEVRQQANMAEFTILIKRSSAIRNPMLELVRGYVKNELNAWKLVIFNGIQNHEMLSYLEGHLARRLMKDDKKIALRRRGIMINKEPPTLFSYNIGFFEARWYAFLFLLEVLGHH
ncbi:hypothetical protein MTR_1g088955 [Medicago truncatula]|uniref:Uncharacterized protein n=1 Tax=Medicago truncatula TaxID=3880 RepID=A0A072VYW1_MEDTR|nr:hypothetical protein MTR_1g088955 [Medicago truncatula]